MSATPTLNESSPLPATDPVPVEHTHTDRPSVADVLVCLPGMTPEALDATRAALAEAFPGEFVQIASPDPAPAVADPQTWLPYPSNRACLGWTLVAADYAAAARVAVDHPARALLLLGQESPLDPQHLRSMVECIRSRNADLAVPRFHLGPNDGLVNGAILYPLTRALFTTDIHFPLPVDAALSQRMATRLATPAQHLYHVGQGEAFLWPVAEAAIAGFAVREVDAGPDAQPPAPAGNFDDLFNSVVAYLFTDVDAKATFWQRARATPVRAALSPAPPAITAEDSAEIAAQITTQIAEMMEAFQFAHANLQEIWSMVLPPQSRLALKKLSLATADTFHMEPALWARIVYDFALAFHLRTLNRGHLLGAMRPLYLAWAASHLRASEGDVTLAARNLEQTATAFDAEKSYIVSRWRWPDRFNP
jgi:hypothetical protein